MYIYTYITELGQKIRNLLTDKFHLEEQCQQLQQQLSSLLAKQQSTVTGPNMKNVKDKGKFCFILFY